ncbi:MAG: ABC transporter permease [Magnetococcus sp. DMHC-1]
MPKPVEEYTNDGSIPSVVSYMIEMVSRKEVIFRLAIRDMTVRFRQTLAGIAWLAIKPMIMAVVLVFVFGRVSGMEVSSSSPYLMVVMAGLVPWQYFSLAMSEATTSMVNNRDLVTKIYFPRANIPLSVIVGLTTELVVALAVMACLMAWYEIWPGWRLLALPLWTMVLFLLTFSLGLFLSALNAYYRDVQHALPFALQMSMFASPVGYELINVPIEWRLLYSLNPFVGVAEGFRWSLLPGHPFHSTASIIAILTTVLLVPISMKIFLLMDRVLVDRI